MPAPASNVVVQTAMPAYRQGFARAVDARLDGDVFFVVGEELFAEGAFTDMPDGVKWRPAHNLFMLRRRLLWQFSVLRPAFAARRCVIEINPRILSGWLILFGRRMLRRRTVLWGHAWSRSGPAARSNRVRILLCRVADGVVVYTASQRDALAEHLPNTPVSAAPNAIDSAADMNPVAPRATADDFIVSGRLVDEKKPLLAVRAFADALADLPPAARLVFIGTGELSDAVRGEADRLGLGERVAMPGGVYDVESQRDYYSGAVAALSPGCVGLSIIQANAFGLPMIYAEDEPHGPEIEAAEEGFNSVVFPSDDSSALAAAMIALVARRDEWSARREAISQASRERYSVEAMAEGFVSALLGE